MTALEESTGIDQEKVYFDQEEATRDLGSRPEPSSQQAIGDPSYKDFLVKARAALKENKVYA